MTIAIQETDHRRSLLLEKGADLLLRSGYEGAEVSDLVRAARLSERDFYQLFSSKEQFASEVLEAYTQQNIDFSRRLLGNKAVPAVKRLLKFYEANIRTVTVLLDFERGCLLSKIGQEMAFKCPLLANSVRENLERLRQEIEQVLEGQEVVVGASEQATLDSQTVSVIERMNASEASNETPPALEELSAVAEPVRVQSAPIGLREQAEAMTLVQLDQELIERAADGQGQTDLRDELASAYTTERDAALDRLEEHASAFDLSSTDALRNEYQFLEVVNLRDETQVSGAVVAQAGDVLVVHTTAGIRRVRIPDVSYIDYLQQ